MRRFFAKKPVLAILAVLLVLAAETFRETAVVIRHFEHLTQSRLAPLESSLETVSACVSIARMTHSPDASSAAARCILASPTADPIAPLSALVLSVQTDPSTAAIALGRLAPMIADDLAQAEALDASVPLISSVMALAGRIGPASSAVVPNLRSAARSVWDARHPGVLDQAVGNFQAALSERELWVESPDARAAVISGKLLP